MKAVCLRTDYLKEPLGLGSRTPAFFWNCEGGKTQTAYRIVVRREDEILWDTGKVSSAKMTQIRYEGKPFQSRDSLRWSVRLWDEEDREGDTAESFFEMGLLASSDWKAEWISGDYRPVKGQRYPADLFRKTFDLKPGIRKARLYASARGIYTACINGRELRDFILAPGMTDYRKRIQYQVYDVTEDLKRQNELLLTLGDGWFRGSTAAYGVTNVYGTQTSVIAQLEVLYEDGTEETVVTDGSWAWSNDGPVRFNDLKDGEIYDARMTPTFSGRATGRSMMRA